MRAAALVSVGLCVFSATYARTPTERLKDERLEAVHSQIVEWKMTRASLPGEGVYQDYRAVFLPAGAAPVSPDALLTAARDAEVRVVFGASTTSLREGVLFLPDPGFNGADISGLPQEEDAQRLPSKFKQRPDEAFGADTHAPTELLSVHTVLFARTHLPAVKTKDYEAAYTAAFRHATTHILAAELTPAAINASLAAGHVYVAHDWLCDPTGATFFAQSYFGLFEIGDTVVHSPATGGVNVSARLPVPAVIRLLRDNTVVAEARDWKLNYVVREPGAYRLEALLAIDGEERPWISTNPIFVGPPSNLALPAVPASPNVDVEAGISYTAGEAADANKHKLDLYLPRDKKNFPVLVFLHGGSWRNGDRSLYGALGERLARAGIGVAIPSYRLMPKNPHPAQMEDVAAAFAWVARNIAERGGDTSRIYLSGHSAGAHLAALLALDEKYLKKFDLAPTAIRAVIAMSGVYDVDNLKSFLTSGDDKDSKHDASPLAHVHSGAPPFLISYCQWDYQGLPKQARDFTAALKKNFVSAQLVYVPAESHISEVLSLVQDHGLLLDAVLNAINTK